MVPKSKIKFIKSLQLKKYRKQEQCFLVEGEKSVLELLVSDFKTDLILGTEQFIQSHEILLSKKQVEYFAVKEDELVSLGSFQSNHSALAVARIKPNIIPASIDGFCIALDGLRDPGNLGTIIRAADWYGIQHIIGSEDSADFYNPKTISSTMGSFCRVNFAYANLGEWLRRCGLPVFGAFLEGENVHITDFGSKGVILIGSESHGISPLLTPLVGHKITIPKIGVAESLNAAMATGIILDNLSRLKK